MRGARRFLLGLLLVTGCGARRALPLDTSLPDGEVRLARPPAEALEVTSADANPVTRGPALAWMVRGLPADEITRWVMQGTYDPDPWVQALVADALLDRRADPAVREQLVEYILRRSGDPYVRAHAAHVLVDDGLGDSVRALRGTWAGQPAWRAAPIALVATRLGDEAARIPLELALAQGEVRDELTFMVDLGEHGWPALAEALARGSAWTEEETGLRLGLAQALLGDTEGAEAWRRALRSPEVELQQEALELVLALPADGRAAWAKVARQARDPGVRLAARAVFAPSAATIQAALASPDPFARLVGVRLAEERPAAEAERLLAAPLADDNAVVRTRAAGVVGRLGLRALADRLIPLTVDDRNEVRTAAYGALFVMGVEPASP